MNALRVKLTSSGMYSKLDMQKQRSLSRYLELSLCLLLLHTTALRPQRRAVRRRERPRRSRWPARFERYIPTDAREQSLTTANLRMLGCVINVKVYLLFTLTITRHLDATWLKYLRTASSQGRRRLLGGAATANAPNTTTLRAA
eukprot:scaffold96862_cov62-Phaeocystis_antarctica.AAC.5